MSEKILRLLNVFDDHNVYFPPDSKATLSIGHYSHASAMRGVNLPLLLLKRAANAGLSIDVCIYAVH